MGARPWTTPSPPPPSLPAGPLNPTCGTIPVVSSGVPQAASRAAPPYSMASDLPPCLALPDGEELPYGSSTRLRIRDYDQESEIYRECIRPPPNRSVLESGEPPLSFRCRSVGILSTPPKTSCGMLCWKGCTEDKTDLRVVLDPSGQPVVMRSKSVSTGSSNNNSCLHQKVPPLSVMVPVCRPNKSSAASVPPTPPASVATAPAAQPPSQGVAAVKSRVRSLCEKVTSTVRTEKLSSAAPALGGVVNAAFENSSSSSSSAEKLANLPVVSCAAVNSSAAPIMNS